ncbi:tetratricopeptide repeat protein [Polaromonas sp. YR568]|uniref:LytR C-terminal domain-containing protein n=1 Tax=Polaromonas sp. YR568 TaxID=1855301 RepID=UPI0031383CD0
MNPHAHARFQPSRRAPARVKADRQAVTMPRFRTIVSLIVGAGAVMGCASPGQDQFAGPYVRPMQAVRHGADSQALYQTGRYFQGQGRYEQAIAAYRQVLTANPDHVDAHNALGVTYSLQGRPELAEQQFSAALAIEPDAARVHNNLGYHLMVNGRMEEALASFEHALALAPKDAMVTANMAVARGKLGLRTDVQRPTVPQVQAAAQPVAAVLAPTQALVSEPAPDVTMRLDRLSDSMWALRSATAAQPATVAGARTAAAARDSIEVYPRSVAVVPSPAATANRIAAEARIEIANGNGATGLAKRVWSLLAPQGMERPRLTNDKPYGVVTSRIEYVAGAEQVARDVNAGLPAQLPLARVSALERNVSVRVLLGKDFPRNAAAVVADAPVPVQVTAASPSGGPLHQ